MYKTKDKICILQRNFILNSYVKVFHFLGFEKFRHTVFLFMEVNLESKVSGYAVVSSSDFHIIKLEELRTMNSEEF